MLYDLFFGVASPVCKPRAQQKTEAVVDAVPRGMPAPHDSLLSANIAYHSFEDRETCHASRSLVHWCLECLEVCRLTEIWLCRYDSFPLAGKKIQSEKDGSDGQAGLYDEVVKVCRTERRNGLT